VVPQVFLFSPILATPLFIIKDVIKND